MKRYPYALIGSFNIVKISILPKPICRFNAIPMKYQMAFFTEVNKTIFVFFGTSKD